MKVLFTCIICLFVFTAAGQPRTMGLVTYDESVEGFFTFAPKNGTEIYLVDVCGEIVNEWVSTYKPGNTDYLTPEGDLISERLLGGNPRIGAGGQGGIIEQYTWDGDLVWSYIVSDSFELAHHEFNLMPNGNLLVLAWDYRDYNQAVQAGRDTGQLLDAIWSEKIIEIRPIFPDSAEIVWEWYLWDHLIQEHDSTKDNFGIVKDHPERLDINYTIGPVRDWIHANSLDYDPASDQILLSSRDIDEFYVIDHSTTTEEAASSSGGQSGKGGDFLFRMGNPQVFDAGTEDDRSFYDQHNVNWVKGELTDAGSIMVFNNGRGRPDSSYSQVLKVTPSRDTSGSYILDTVFQVDTIEVIYEGQPRTSFYAALLSGATQLTDNSYLVSHGPYGEFFEINDQREILWKYVIPIDLAGNALPQGTDPASLQTGLTRQNFFFRAVKYAPDFPGFDGRDMSGLGFLETDPLQGLCQDTMVTSTIELVGNALHLYPNPVRSGSSIALSNMNNMTLRQADLLNEGSQLVRSWKINQACSCNLNMPSDTPPGMYFLRLSLEPIDGRGELQVIYKKLLVQ